MPHHQDIEQPHRGWRRKKLLRASNLYVVAAFLALVIIVASIFNTERRPPVPHVRDYAEIAAQGIIRATMEYNATSFFISGDTLAGFNYELLHAFARDHSLKVEIYPEMAFDKSLKGLEDGKCDLIANLVTSTNELKDSLLLTVPIVLSRQILVQRKPQDEKDSAFITSPLSLAGKTVHVVKDSPAILRIHNLSGEIGDTIYIEEIEKYGTEQLMALVAHGDIDYAVCDENIAQALADSLPQLDISTPIGFTQFYSWVVSKRSPALLDSLNAWLEAFKQEKAYRKLYQKYYKAGK